ncbi:MAG TPA: phage tail protein [Acidobacteriaceae bacterium]|nr:phage tail protein [Acidobacteriaceae bacterium]
MRKTFAFAVCCFLFSGVAQAPAQPPTQVTSSKHIAVSISGVPIDGVRSVSGLESIDKVESMEEGSGAANRTRPAGTVMPKQMPGHAQAHTFVLSRAVTQNDALHQWHERVAHGTNDRRSVDITFDDAEGRPLRKYHFTKCWPSRYSRADEAQRQSGLDLEKIEVTCESVQVQ